MYETESRKVEISAPGDAPAEVLSRQWISARSIKKEKINRRCGSPLSSLSFADEAVRLIAIPRSSTLHPADPRYPRKALHWGDDLLFQSRSSNMIWRPV